MRLKGPVWLMQPIPYFGESISGDWIYEPKIDGWRLQILKFANGKVEIWGRRLERNPNWTKKLERIAVKAGELFPPGILLDAEISTRRGRRFIPSIFAAKTTVKPIIYIFDIIFYQNEFVGELPLKERKRILSSLKFEPPFKHVKYKPIKDIKSHLWKLVQMGHEGMVIKRLNSTYQIGRDCPIATENWRKIKP